MLKSINMRNFRAFKDVTLSDIPQVCLISGKNSVGKSTILEALFFFYCAHMPTMLTQVQAARNPTLSPDAFLPSLFHNFSTLEEISLEITDESSTTTTCYTLGDEEDSAASFVLMHSDKDKKDKDSPLAALFADINKQPPISVLKINRSSRPTSSVNANVEKEEARVSLFEDMPIGRRHGSPLHPKYIVNFMNCHSENWSQELTSIYSQLEDDRREDDALAIVRQIVPKVSKLRLGVKNDNTMILCRVDGINGDVPLGHMGEGVARSFSIISRILANAPDILLIDEIENGIHFSALETFWEAILTNAQKTSCQIFATTHSYENIAAATKAYKRISLNNSTLTRNDLFAYYRLDRRDENIVATRYASSELEEALNSEWEVR